MLAFLVLVVGGVGQSGFGTMQSTITMLSAPPDMRGRMVGLMSVCIGIGTPVGGLAIGILAELFGTPLAITVNAVFGLFPAVAGADVHSAGLGSHQGGSRALVWLAR